MSSNTRLRPIASEPFAARKSVPAHRSRLGLLTSLALGVLMVDQITKACVLSALEQGAQHPVLGNALGIQLLLNPGAVLGLGSGSTWLLTVIAVAATVLIVRFSRRLSSTWWTVTLGLLLGGTLGNLIDRLMRDPGFGRGHVIDFIAYGDLFVGNVADIAIAVAAGLMMILSYRKVQLDGTQS